MKTKSGKLCILNKYFYIAAAIFINSVSFDFLSAADLERASGDVDLVLYGGKYTDTNFSQIILHGKTNYKESYIAAGALNYRLEPRIRSIFFESEGQIVKHAGVMNHHELNGVLIARYHFSFMPASFAFGEGLSIASKTPELENRLKDIMALRFEDRERSKPVLNYFLFELDFSLPVVMHDPRIFIRLHHRSGVFGTYCSKTCGSNFITYGIKIGTD